MNVVKMIVIVLLFLLLCVAITFLVRAIIDVFCDDGNYMTGNAPTITYRLFIEMYAINSIKWSLEDDYVCYIDGGSKRRIVFKTERDYKKYKKFRKEEIEKKRKLERIKAEAELAKCFQADIDRYRAETMKEMKSHLPENMIPHDTGALRRSNTYD